MSVDPRLPALMRISGLVRESSLAALHRAETERAVLMARLADLEQPAVPPAGIGPAAAEAIGLRYERWAAQRKREIEAALVEKADECRRLREKAQLALGRDDALCRLVERK